MDVSVSVIIPAFNAAGFITRAIESAANQTLRPLEILVVDDASSDSTCQVVRELAARWPTISLIRFAQNQGPSAARNAAIEVAKGDWIAILDADDAWKPERLAVLTALGREKQADFIADNIILFDAASQRKGRNGFEADWKIKKLSPRDLFESDIPETSHFSYSLLKPVMRRQFLLNSGLRYDETTRYGEDFRLYAEMLFNGASVWVTSDPLYVYSTRFGEFSGKPSTHSRSIPRFDHLVMANDDLAKKYSGHIDENFRRVIRRRGRRLGAVHRGNVARQYRMSGRYVHYTALIATDFDLFVLLLIRTTKRIFRRLRISFQRQKPSEQARFD